VSDAAMNGSCHVRRLTSVITHFGCIALLKMSISSISR
jgi:hypothetical protein